MNLLPRNRSLGVNALWITASIGVLEAFYYWDWGHGQARFFLLVLLGVLVLALLLGSHRQSPAIPSTPLLKGLLLSLLLFSVGINVATGIRSMDRSLISGELRGDQPQALLRAIHATLQGIDPYGQHIMLDPIVYQSILEDFRRHPECGIAPDPFRNGDYKKYYASPSVQAAAPLFPKINDVPSCRFFQKAFASLGFRYGPMNLLAHLPAVLLLGGEGILVDHFIFFTCLLGMLVLWFYQDSHSVASTILPLFIFLLPIHLRLNSFDRGLLDIHPTLYAIGFLWATSRNKPRWAAFLLGLSVSSKLFPALLYAPLLLRKPKEIPFFFLPVVLLYGPFLFWDPQGFWNNLTFSLLVYPVDSTTIRYYLPTWTGPLFIGGVLLLAGIGLLWVRKKRWSMKAMTVYVFFLHLAAYISARDFHNNHLVWLLPCLSVLFFYSIRPERKPTTDLLS